MKLFNEINFKSDPVLLAAWPGMGNVGIMAMDYMRSKLNAVLFAEIDMAPYFTPDSIVVKDGIAQLPKIPGAVFHYLEEPSLIIFESSAQVGGRDGIAIIKTIIDMAKQFNVKEIFTAAAFATPVGFQSESQVLTACNTPALLTQLYSYGIKPMPDGFIAGQNGLLLGIAGSHGITAGCLLGTIPSYASNLSYPKASMEILRKFEKILGIGEIDYTDLKESIAEINKQLSEIEDRIKEYFPSVAEEHLEEEILDIDDDEVPGYIMQKIERLFKEVEEDHSKGPILKQELDRWNLYELYEDRFLKIFSENGDNE